MSVVDRIFKKEAREADRNRHQQIERKILTKVLELYMAVVAV
jgi:hypothetical protein